jgi:hypothetical protein
MEDNKTHVCIHERDFGEILGIQTTIIKEFYGNGNEGMSKTIPKLEIQIASLTEATTGQATAISALAKAVTEITSVNTYKEKEKLNTRQRTSILLSIIIGGSGVIIAIITLIDKLLN